MNPARSGQSMAHSSWHGAKRTGHMRTGQKITRDDMIKFEYERSNRMVNRGLVIICGILFILSCVGATVHGMDTELTRITLAGIQGIHVKVEELQPNIQKYASRFNITQEQLRKDVTLKLEKAGIIVLSSEKWLKTTGRPLLYVNVNTHETEKYWYAFNINIQVRQVVSLESNPNLKTMADTWSIDMTGIANIGTLNMIRDNVGNLVDRFVNVYLSVNAKK